MCRVMGIPNGQIISITDFLLWQISIDVSPIPHILSKFRTHKKKKERRKYGALRSSNIETFIRLKSGKIVAGYF